MTGYQEILTDPSYAGQLITFTFPHIGNVGTNEEDLEATTCYARGLVLRAAVSGPSNYRAVDHLDRWLARQGLVGIAGIDTRRLTRRLRDAGAQTAALGFHPEHAPDRRRLTELARAWPGLLGMDLAAEVSCRQRYEWTSTSWQYPNGYGESDGGGRHHVVALDYGIKRNILRSLVSLGLRVTVVPATTSAEDVLALRPDGIFLSNGPGDPAAVTYGIAAVTELVASGRPLFGICLGHQILGLALGAKTFKLRFGHHGGNHPVKDLTTGKVEITAQNHGFAVDPASLPPGVALTHVNLYDQTAEGLACDGRPVSSVQYHPEASPGPHDASYLFARFRRAMEAR
jgi:carbamoyl-phosphate synthase small subunit